MSVNMKYVRKLLQAAKREGMSFLCYYDSPFDPDYQGEDIEQALKALEACDEMKLSLIKDEEALGWALIIQGLSPDETIANYAGDFIDNWWNENVRDAA